MSAARYHLVLGLACSLPVVIWTLSQDPARLQAGAWSQTILTALEAQWLLLALGAALFLPWHAHRWAWRDSLLGSLVPIAVCLPFLALVWLSGDTAAGVLARGLVLLSAFSLMTALIGRAIAGLRLGAETKTLGRVATQTLLAAAVWTFSPLWLPWTGL